MNFLLFLIALFETMIVFLSSCGHINSKIGSGSYYMQAGKWNLNIGAVSVLPTDITNNFQANSGAGGFAYYNVSLKYTIANYSLVVGWKRISWQFDTNLSYYPTFGAYMGSHSPDRFTFSVFSSYGACLFDFEATYLVIDSNLGAYIMQL